MSEIEAADAPGAYLQSLHPKHEQFERLRQALLKARGGGSEEDEGGKPAGNDKDIKRLIINMERWRWMPEDLGSIYVLNNSPAFMLFVVKDGKTIFADKTLVGTIGYATPVFTADMKTIVFNPDWNAPETVVKENILPPLQQRNYSILRIHKLYVSSGGTPIDATKVDWNRVNVLNYTFSQRAGPHNNLGKVKFLFPNRHTVYMHDTLPVRKKYFKQPVRTIGHECVRMEKPDRFAEILLAEDKGWASDRVKELWDNGVNSPVALDKKIPVHMVYFTAVVDESGKVDISGDVYGLDRKLAAALFGDTTGFPAPPPESKQPPPGRLTRQRPPGGGRPPTTTSRGRCRASRATSAPSSLLGLRAVPRLDRLGQHGVEAAVGGQLGDAFPETLGQRAAGRLLGEGDEHLGRHHRLIEGNDLVLQSVFGRFGETGIIARDQIIGLPGHEVLEGVVDAGSAGDVELVLDEGIEIGAVALALVGDALLADQVVLTLEGELLALDHEDRHVVEHEGGLDVIEIGGALIVVVDAENHVGFTVPRRRLSLLPGAHEFRLKRDLEVFGDGPDQCGRGANDVVTVLVGDRRILRMTRGGDLGALVGGEGRVARQREGHEHSQAEKSFHDREFLVPGREGESAGGARPVQLEAAVQAASLTALSSAP